MSLVSNASRPGLPLPNIKSHLKQFVGGRLNDLQHGHLSVHLPDGTVLEFGKLPVATDAFQADVRIRSWKALSRLVFQGELGFARAWIDGDWDSPDLDAFFGLIMQNEDVLFDGRLSANRLTRWLDRRWHKGNANSKKGSKRNIAAHYDLGNDFYKLWLDDSMTYSSALYETGQESLFDAQQAKYHRIAQMADLQPGQRVLEIGCGWGGFSEIAATHYGCDITGVTLSEEQLAWANNRYEQAGIADRARARLTDYRDITGSFDRIVSIEMFEAVGEEHWDTYFDVLRERLVPGGTAVLQVITIDDDRFDAYRNNVDFIQRYIFPGGMLPSPEKLTQKAIDHGFEAGEPFFFGKSYATTCHRWKDLFNAQTTALDAQGFDERFRRMWQYYLSYCIAGFNKGSIDVGLFKLTSPKGITIR